MAEWDDLEIVQSPDTALRRRFRWPLLGGIVVLAFALGFLLYFLFRGPELPAPAPSQVQERPAASEPAETTLPEPEPEPPMELPPLDESDLLVREFVDRLSSHAELAGWVMNDDLIRKFTAIVDNVAEGVSPAPHLAFLKPSEEFQVTYRSGLFYIDPGSYERYNLVADVFGSVNTGAAAELYRDLKPLIQEAYAELGYPDRDFDETLSLAMDRLLKTPILEGEVELDGTKVSYRYADPGLERLTPAQKHFLRMGPRNVRKMQAKLTELKRALRLPTVLSH
jgi:hypothetical protein